MGASRSARPRLGSATAVLGASFAWLCCGIVLADEAAARKAEAEALIRGMLQEREKIVSGMVEFKGSMSLSAKEGKQFEGKLSGRLYFDSDFRRLRFDNDVESMVRLVNASNLPRGAPDLKTALQAVPSERKLKQFRFIRQPEYCTYWEGIGKGVSSNVILRLPDKSIGKALPSTHHLYDFRAAGILSYMEFGRGELERGVTVKDYCERLNKLTLIDVTRNGPQAQIVFEDPHSRRTLTIDTARGFTPVEYVLTSLTDPAVQIATVEWENRDGIYVPTEMSIQLGAPHVKLLNSYRIEFDWKSINTPVDDKHFDYRNLPDVAPGINVLDTREGDGKPKRLGKWPLPRDPTPEPPDTAKPPKPSPEP